MTHQATLFCRRLSVVFALTMLALGASAIQPVAAQGTVAQREGCEGDAFKFCSSYIPFVHAIENCLHRNMRNLTPACRTQMRGCATASRRR
jgi:hypothetical protein